MYCNLKRIIMRHRIHAIRTLRLNPSTGAIDRLRLLLVSLGSLLMVHVALSQVPQDRSELLNGEGLDQVQVAESNGYPGPKRLIDNAKDLQLTEPQLNSIRQLYSGMNTRAKELAQRIIGIEEELNDAFKTGLISEKSILDDAEQIGKLRGRLRAVHLAASLKAKAVLTQTQLEAYRKLKPAVESEKRKK